MVGLATLLQTFIYPGIFFPALTKHRADKETREELVSDESSTEKDTGNV